MNLAGISLIGLDHGHPSEGIASHSAADYFFAVNPATREPLAPGYLTANAADVHRAAQLAADAFGVYSRVSAKHRAAFLDTIAAQLESARDDIVQRANLETALPTQRLESELARTCFQLRFYGQLAADGFFADARIDHGDAQRKPIAKPDVRSMMRPLGPVAVFGASNFPLAYSVAGGDTASALAAGNPVIVKAHPAHPGTSEIVGHLVQQAIRQVELPDGVFSLLFDSKTEVGLALVRHAEIKAVGFTGSRLAGKALMRAAFERREPIPVYAEMSSVNPVFILPGALRSRGNEIAAGLRDSVTSGVGQFCTDPGLIFVPGEQEAARFCRQLADLMAKTLPGTMLNAGICRNYRLGIDRLARTKGVEQLAGVRVDESSNMAGAALFSTGAQTFLTDETCMQEVFGPSTLAIHCSNLEEMIAAARALEGQLTASVFGDESDLLENARLLGILEAKVGRMIINGFPTGLEVCHAIVHGGPFPATSDGRSTSVGGRAAERFARPVCYQNYPAELLPDELKESNPLGIWRIVDGERCRG